MSDSELSEASNTPIPPDFELENSLRREVNRAAGEGPTLNQIRTASEKRLGLPAGFYKNDAVWKAKSKEVVQDQVVSTDDYSRVSCVDTVQENENEVPSSPELKTKAKPKPVPRNESESPRPSKRKSVEKDSPPPKKRKTKTVPSDDDESSLSDVESHTEPEEKPKRGKKAAQRTNKPAKKTKATKAVSDSDEDEPAADGSESEMSVVLDEEPKPKRKSKSKSAEPKSKSTKPAKPKAAEDDPDQAEIKRLQMWLGRCGVRKVWGAYLKPYETPKAKIKHLKDMLSDVGMTGRYSQEKATQIKEARELAEDIAAVTEGEQRWGAGEKQSEDEDEKPKGRLQRGSRAHYDFLSSDGEETS